MSTTTPDDLAADTPICPECNYDLRGISSERCPECGFDLTLLGDGTSSIPWANRQALGYVHAWLRTVWRFSARSAWLRHEIARPVSLHAAKRFWFITATLLSLPAIAIAIWPRSLNRSFSRMTFGAFDPLLSINIPRPVAIDASLPWMAGMMVYGLPPLLVWLAVLLCTGVHTYFFHPMGRDRRRGDRAVALSYYLVATLLWPMLWLTAAMLLFELPFTRRFLPRLLGHDVFDMVAFGTPPLLLGHAMVRAVVALRMTTQASGMYQMLFVVALPIAWAICIGFALGFLPWTIGYVWLTIDALI